jgi:hypothetical protein
VVVFGGRAEDRAVLERAQYEVEAFVRLEGDVLGILVTNRAEPTPHVANLDDGTTQPAG